MIFLIAFAVQGWAAKPPTPKPPIATFQVPRVIADSGVTFTAQNTPDFDKLPRVIQEALSPLRVINRNYSGSDSSGDSTVYHGGQRAQSLSRPAYLLPRQFRAVERHQRGGRSDEIRHN